MDSLLVVLTEALGPLLTSFLAIVFHPIILVTAIILGTLGEATKRLVNVKAGDKGWRGVFHVTLPAHPVLVGLLLGFVPWLPPVDALVKEGYEGAGRVATYALAGFVCKIGYDTLVATVQRWLRTRISGASVRSSDVGTVSETASKEK